MQGRNKTMFHTTELKEYITFFCEYKAPTNFSGSRYFVKNSEGKRLFTVDFDYSGKNRETIAKKIKERYMVDVNSCSDYSKGFILLGERQ